MTSLLRTCLLVLLAWSACTSSFANAAPRVALETTHGTIVLELFPEKAPEAVANFLAYVDSGFYDGLIFHRVIPGFMVQGGGFDTDYQQRETRPPINNESRNGLSNQRGTIAMARMGHPNSATSQFFINLVDNRRLDGSEYRWGYTVFGQVVDGMSVVDAIAEVATGPAGDFPKDAPQAMVIIHRAKRIDSGASSLL